MQVIGKRKRTSKDKADSIERIKIENNYRNGTRQSQANEENTAIATISVLWL